MALSRMNLFFNRFVAFNLDRYQDDAEMLPLFQGLQENELTFEALTGTGADTRSLTVKSVSRNFMGVNQTYHAAELNNVRAYSMVEPGVVAPTLADLDEKTVPGVYAYLDADGVTTKIMILIDDKAEVGTDAAAAIEALTSAFKYDLLPGDITSGADALTIEAPCFYGVLSFKRAAAEVLVIPATDYGQLEFPE